MSSPTLLVQLCRDIVYSLRAKHQWTLVSADDLLVRVLQSLPVWTPEHDQTQLVEAITRQVNQIYSGELYAACKQSADLELRERAYAELFRYLYKAAYRSGRPSPEDAVQQALLLVYEQIDRCRNPTSFRAFATYKLWAAFKLLAERSSESLTDEGGQSEIEDLRSKADTLQLEAEQRQALQEALDRLPDERQRAVVVLKFFQHLSDDVIAKRLGLTVNHVRVLRNRALNRLRSDERLMSYFVPEQ